MRTTAAPSPSSSHSSDTGLSDTFSNRIPSPHLQTSHHEARGSLTPEPGSAPQISTRKRQTSMEYLVRSWLQQSHRASNDKVLIDYKNESTFQGRSFSVEISKSGVVYAPLNLKLARELNSEQKNAFDAALEELNDFYIDIDKTECSFSEPAFIPPNGEAWEHQGGVLNYEAEEYSVHCKFDREGNVHTFQLNRINPNLAGAAHTSSGISDTSSEGPAPSSQEDKMMTDASNIDLQEPVPSSQHGTPSNENIAGSSFNEVPQTGQIPENVTSWVKGLCAAWQRDKQDIPAVAARLVYPSLQQLLDDQHEWTPDTCREAIRKDVNDDKVATHKLEVVVNSNQKLFETHEEDIKNKLTTGNIKQRAANFRLKTVREFFQTMSFHEGIDITMLQANELDEKIDFYCRRRMGGERDEKVLREIFDSKSGR